MTIFIAKDDPDWARLCADIIMGTVGGVPYPVLYLTNGGTPLPAYDELAVRHEQGASFRHVTAFVLDEYIGLPRGHSEGSRTFMERNLFNRIDIPIDRQHVPDGFREDYEQAAADYETAMAAAGGADLAVIGVGVNGHIASNEPGTPFDSLTHVVPLTPATRTANSKFFNSIDEVPHHAITMGLKTIMDARKILLMARGHEKAAIIAQVLRGEVTPNVPGSVLQNHPDVIVVLDQAAAAQL